MDLDVEVIVIIVSIQQLFFGLLTSGSARFTLIQRIIMNLFKDLLVELFFLTRQLLGSIHFINVFLNSINQLVCARMRYRRDAKDRACVFNFRQNVVDNIIN